MRNLESIGMKMEAEELPGWQGIDERKTISKMSLSELSEYEHRMYTTYEKGRTLISTFLTENASELQKLKDVKNLHLGLAEYYRYALITMPTFAYEMQQRKLELKKTQPLEENNSEIDINPADLKIDFYRSSAGGQHVNKNETSVRITHIPTNTVVDCQSGRTRYTNRELAMKMLKDELKKDKQ